MLSFTTTKLLSLLVYPVSLGMLLFVVGILLYLLRLRRTGVGISILGVAWIYVCSTALFTNFLIDFLERDYVPRAMSVIAEADAIVLLGGAIRGDTHLGTRPDLNQQADRLIHALALYKAGKAPVVVLSGGSPQGGRPEAKQMRDLLMLMGMPRRAMLLENQSRNTRENAQYTATILNSKGMQRILLVTSAFHMRRAVPLFEAQGFDVVPAPTDYQRLVAFEPMPGWLPSVANLSRSTHALHELAGYVVYRWRGWL